MLGGFQRGVRRRGVHQLVAENGGNEGFEAQKTDLNPELDNRAQGWNPRPTD